MSDDGDGHGLGDSDDGDAGSQPWDGPDVSRRRFLAGAGGSLAAIGAGRAVYNTTLGYGELGMGTNLHEQDLGAVLGERLRVSYEEDLAGIEVSADGEGVVARADGETYRLGFDRHDRDEAARLDADLGAEGRLLALFEDAADLAAGAYGFEFSQPEAFFERLADADPRAGAVAAVRGRFDRTVDPETVASFAGASPRDVEALAGGLVEGFREHTSYDVPRYLAGSVEDNVIFGARDLRGHFEDEVDFGSLLEADSTGIFCWELVYRSIEAFQAVAPGAQTVPVAACYVSDHRHKHAFTGLVSAIREDGDLRLPTTFVDYTHTTMYDDFRLRGILGEGLAAYDTSHRADDVYW